jgi:serine/threonine protein kinase/tetratricopeptide (TPR) repeat protein
VLGDAAAADAALAHMPQPGWLQKVMINQPRSSFTGRRIGSYEILSKLGAGGMGEVYRARDQKLCRDVAIKLLPETFTPDGERLARFEREARLLASLNHPHIGAIYGLEEEDGIRALVLELVEGESLAERIARGPASLLEVLRIGIQLTSALAFAHDHGILHRDIKPANVMVLRDDTVKLVDFGIAKAALPARLGTDAPTEAGSTREGTLLGTLQYMSPEQLCGRPLDARSDVFSVGLVLYEAATGAHPFRGETPLLAAAAILEGKCPRLPVHVAASGALNPILQKALARDMDDRYAHMGDLHADLVQLENCARDGAARRTLSEQRLSRARPPTKRRQNAQHRTAHLSRIRSLAVLPLKDFSAERSQPFFTDGLTEAVTAALASLRGLRVISRTSAMRYETTEKPLSQVAQELSVDGVLEGSIIRSGGRVRLSVHLIDAVADAQLWTGAFDRDLGDVLALQDEFALAVAREIQLTVLPSDPISSRQPKKVQPAAHDAYMRGRYLLERQTLPSLQQSFKYLSEAAMLAPQFAPTFVALGEWYFTASLHGLVEAGHARQSAKAAAETAIRLDSSLPAAHALLAEAAFVEWRFGDAELGFRKAVAIGPNDVWSIRHLGRFLTYVGRSAEAINVMASAERLDPLSAGTLAGVATALYCDRRYRDAISVFDKALELDTDSPRLLCQQGAAFTLSGGVADALKCFKRAMANPDVTGYMRSALTAARIYAFARSSRRKTAAELIIEFEASAVEAMHVAAAYAGLENVSKAVEYLDKAVAVRGLPVLAAKCDPVFDPIRSAGEFQQVLGRLGLED